MTSLTKTAKALYDAQRRLSEHEAAAKETAAAIRADIRKHSLLMETATEGLDADRLALAKTVIYVRGTYARAGEDRASVVHDAIKQLATGETIRPTYGDLMRVYFGTKNYYRWSGQRSDHEYGYGPKHGYTCFAIGFTENTRKRCQSDLTPDEVEAAVYYLANLERVQSAEQRADAA